MLLFRTCTDVQTIRIHDLFCKRLQNIGRTLYKLLLYRAKWFCCLVTLWISMIEA